MQTTEDVKKNQDNRVCIITGGAQGIGKGIAKYFLERNCSIVIADIDDKKGEETFKELSSIFKNVKFVKTDVSKEDEVQKMIEETIKTFGRLDVLINNAAISNPYTGNIETMELNTWMKYLNVNLTSVFLCSKHAIPYLKLQKGSAIINISSTRALQSEENSEAYAATKGGIVSLTHAMARSLGERFRIRVNCISPGWIDVKNAEFPVRKEDHEQHLVGRVGETHDISSLAYFLAFPETSGFITGQNFVVDGGMTIKMQYIE